MKILHLTSDWKWTGPAEPMLQLLIGQRAVGARVDLACPDPPPDADTSLRAEALARGVTPCFMPSRGRGFLAWRDARDIGRLAGMIERRGYGLIHVWHTRDHLLALAARARRADAAAPSIVRSLRRAEAIPRWPWNRWLFAAGSDGLVCVSPAAGARNRELRGGRPALGVFGAVDLERFAPQPPDPATRRRLGLSPAHRVVGIVARVQPQRRFDLLLEAMARLVRKDPLARLLVVGRGTRREQVAVEPARRLGLTDRVVFAGYRRNDYVDVLRAIDVFTTLVPGSDGGCRALLEAAACGLPAVTSARGALAEIVEDGVTGQVVCEDAEVLATAWAGLLADPARRQVFGRAARRRAESRFSIAGQVAAVDALYRTLPGAMTSEARARSG